MESSTAASILSFGDLHHLSFAEVKALAKDYPCAAIPAMVAARKARIEDHPNYQELLTAAALRVSSRTQLKTYILAKDVEPIVEEPQLDQQKLEQQPALETEQDPILEEETESQTTPEAESIVEAENESTPEIGEETEVIPEAPPTPETEAEAIFNTEDEEELAMEPTEQFRRQMLDNPEQENETAESELEELYAAQSYAASIEMEAELSEIPEDLIEQQIEKAKLQQENLTPELPGTPVEEQLDEPKTFTDWLAVFNPSQEKENTIEGLEKPTQSEAALRAKRTLPKQDIGDPEDLDTVHLRAKKSISKDKSFYTETLAQIYEDQNKWKQAIEVYEVLGLKYPEKSVFFASRIELLKENLK